MYLATFTPPPDREGNGKRIRTADELDSFLSSVRRMLRATTRDGRAYWWGGWAVVEAPTVHAPAHDAGEASGLPCRWCTGPVPLAACGVCDGTGWLPLAHVHVHLVLVAKPFAWGREPGAYDVEAPGGGGAWALAERHGLGRIHFTVAVAAKDVGLYVAKVVGNYAAKAADEAGKAGVSPEVHAARQDAYLYRRRSVWAFGEAYGLPRSRLCQLAPEESTLHGVDGVGAQVARELVKQEDETHPRAQVWVQADSQSCEAERVQMYRRELAAYDGEEFNDDVVVGDEGRERASTGNGVQLEADGGGQLEEVSSQLGGGCCPRDVPRDSGEPCEAEHSPGVAGPAGGQNLRDGNLVPTHPSPPGPGAPQGWRALVSRWVCWDEVHEAHGATFVGAHRVAIYDGPGATTDRESALAAARGFAGTAILRRYISRLAANGDSGSVLGLLALGVDARVVRALRKANGEGPAWVERSAAARREWATQWAQAAWCYLEEGGNPVFLGGARGGTVGRTWWLAPEPIEQGANAHGGGESRAMWGDTIPTGARVAVG